MRQVLVDYARARATLAEETAEALGESVHIVRHDQRLAQAWLRRELSRKIDPERRGKA